jgi:hypothetical protein
MLRNSLDIIGSYKRRYRDIDCAVWRFADQVPSFLKNFAADRHFLVRYETLVESPEDTLQTLCAWLDIPYENSMLEYHMNNDNWWGCTELKKTSGKGREHANYRNWQTHQPLFDGRNTGMKLLSKKECARLEAGCGKLISVLDNFSYNIPPPPQHRKRDDARRGTGEISC